MKRAVKIISIFALVSFSFSQQGDPELQQQYSFLKTDANNISQPHALDRFFEKLYRLESQKDKTLRIVHIGDSHLQADYFSGQVRQLLQSRFGNAGRGMVFPYRVAGTNGPPDYRTKGSAGWKGYRCVQSHQFVPYGLSGISLHTANGADYFEVALGRTDQSDSINYFFDQITVYRLPGQDAFDLGIGIEMPKAISSQAQRYTSKKHVVRSGESLSVIASRYGVGVSQIKNWNNLRSNLIRPGQTLIVGQQAAPPEPVENVEINDMFLLPGDSNTHFAAFQLPAQSDRFYLRNIRREKEQQQSLVFGVTVENTQNKGVLYHTIGVNGAQYAHYNEAEYFAQHVASLNPDLVIISLGTNEAFAYELDQSHFFEEIDSLVSKLTALCPEANFLLTTQPDSYKKRRYRNDRNIWITETLKDYAATRFTGLWDLNAVMGGYGSMNDWYNSGLTARDKVHFSAAGYRLHGELLYNSLMKSYELYRDTRP